MSVFNSWKFLLAATLAALTAPAAASYAAAAQVHEVVSSVETSWSSHVSSAASARVEFVWTTISTGETTFSVDEVKAFFETFEFSADEECVQRLFEKFNPEVLERYQKHDFTTGPWFLFEEMTLWDDGQQERSISQQHEHLVGRDLHLFYMKDLTGFVTAFDQGTSRYYFPDLELLMSLPESSFLSQVNRVEELADRLRLTTAEGVQLEIDQTSHLPVFREFYNPETGYGRLKFFREPTLFPGDVTIPLYQIEVDFEAGRAEDLRFSGVVDAAFNLDIPASTFVLQVKKGTTLVDKRTDQGRSRRIQQDVDDVAEYFLASGFAPQTQVALSEPFNWKSFFLIINGIFLMLAGVLVWRRSNT